MLYCDVCLLGYSQTFCRTSRILILRISRIPASSSHGTLGILPGLSMVLAVLLEYHLGLPELLLSEFLPELPKVLAESLAGHSMVVIVLS